MRRRALGALLLFLIATPVPVLCAVCTPDACPMDMAPPPAMAEAGCHGMAPAAPAAREAVTPDCCATAAPARDTTPAVPATTPDAPIPAPADGTVPTLLTRSPSPVRVPACEAPPPEPLRPLYTLHSSLLI